MNGRTSLRTGAVLGALGVAAGAFGAHALKAHRSADDLAIWDTAVRYQLWHALALVTCALVPVRAAFASVAFASGVVVFSGSLYALVLTGARWLGAVTPVGGVLLIAGWIALCCARADGRRATDARST